jgi:hypothetical protein
MADDTRTSFGTKVLLVLGAIFAIWIASNIVGHLIGWIFSFLGYIIVAVVAYQMGKLSGKHSDEA